VELSCPIEIQNAIEDIRVSVEEKRGGRIFAGKFLLKTA
jgi:hypothetical protein